MEEWNYLDLITTSYDYIALSKAIESYGSTIPNEINLNDIPFCISIRSDLLPKILEVVRCFMEEYHLQMIYIGGVKFIYGKNNKQED